MLSNHTERTTMLGEQTFTAGGIPFPAIGQAVNALGGDKQWFSLPYPVFTVTPRIKDVIFNNPATIVLWEDGTKTVVKAMDTDAFNPEVGILQAWFVKTSGMTRTMGNKTIQGFVDKYKQQLLLAEKAEQEAE